MVKKLEFFTVCNVLYLDKVSALADSLYETNNKFLNIFIFDKQRNINSVSKYCKIHWIEDYDIPYFSDLAFKYNVIELTTALKPWLALHLLKDASKVIFLDPDTYIYSKFDSVVSELDQTPVLLTPHYLNPKIDGFIDDSMLLLYGSFNMGFFAVRRSLEASKFLSWWSERNLMNAFDDAASGVFTDQKWVSLAPAFFPFMKSSNDTGLNVAFWNLSERTISKPQDGEFYVNDEGPLVFMHFSAFDSSRMRELTKRDFDIGNNSRQIIGDMSENYANHVAKYKNVIVDQKYSYDFFDNGDFISPLLRRAFACMKDELETSDPFCSKSQVYSFGKINGLIAGAGQMKLGRDTTRQKENLIGLASILMRLIMRLLGASNFMKFGLLLSHLTRYHRNKKMWKLPKQ